MRGADQALLSGTVASFDEAAGLGTIEGDGPAPIPFHCTAIADGSRTIEVGTPVVFGLEARHRGRFEAGRVTAAPTRIPSPDRRPGQPTP